MYGPTWSRSDPNGVPCGPTRKKQWSHVVPQWSQRGSLWPHSIIPMVPYAHGVVLPGFRVAPVDNSYGPTWSRSGPGGVPCGFRAPHEKHTFYAVNLNPPRSDQTGGGFKLTSSGWFSSSALMANLLPLQRELNSTVSLETGTTRGYQRSKNVTFFHRF